jgi:hypothetical protein
MTFYARSLYSSNILTSSINQVFLNLQCIVSRPYCGIFYSLVLQRISDMQTNSLLLFQDSVFRCVYVTSCGDVNFKVWLSN